jgi:hypothetical protein
VKREKRFLPFGLLAALVCVWPSTGCADTSNTQVVEMRVVESSTTDLGYGACQWLHPLTAPKEKLSAQPNYRSANPVYYAAVLGDSKDNLFTLVIDESGGTGAGYDTLYVDANNDNRIDPDAERFKFQMSTRGTSHNLRLKFEVTSGGRTAPYWLDFTAFPYTDERNPVEKIHANLRDGSYYVGEAVIGGKTRKIAVADLNTNGLFNDPEVGGIFRGDRFFVDLNDSGKFNDDRDPDGSGGFPYGDYTKIEGRWYRIVARADGAQLTISEADPPLGTVEAPPGVQVAFLSSKTQSCRLDFSTGPAQAVAGTYEVYSTRLGLKDADGRTWSTYATFAENARPQVTVRKDRTVSLRAGPPLRVEPTITRGADPGSLMIGLRITGSAGESYRWSKGNPSTVKPGMEVRDGSGRVVVSADFKYG